jgi:hypothetical protein
VVVRAAKPDLRAQPGVVSKLPERSGQIRELMVGIQPARVGQHPESAFAERLLLATSHSSGTAEGRSIRADPEHCYNLRLMTTDLPLESSPPRAQFLRFKLRRTTRGSRNQVRDSDAVLQERLLLPRAHEPIGKACCVKRRPEPIAWSSEVMPGGGRVKAGIDAAEEDVEMWGDQVGDGAAGRGGDGSFGRSGLHLHPLDVGTCGPGR